MTHSRTKKVILGLILFVVNSGVGAAALCELALRSQEPFLHLMQNRYNINLLYAPHPVWDHWPRPNLRLSVTLLEPKRYPDPLTFRFNSYGCRDGREPQVPKPPGLRRILVMGDSFTEGLYETDTAAAELQRRLDRIPGEYRYEVMNCGCVSYSPLLHFLRLKHELLRLAPDIVVVNIDLTDVYDDYMRYRPLYDFSPDGEPVSMRNPARWGNRFTSWAVAEFDTARVLYAYRARFLRAVYRPLVRLGFNQAFLGIAPNEDALFSYHSTMPVDSEEWRRGVSFCLANVFRLVQLARKNGVRPIITIYPHKEQLRPDRNGRLWHREFEYRLERLCRDSGVEYYSAFDGIRQAFESGQPVFFEDDMHFTPEGQRLWGGLLAKYVVSRLEAGKATSAPSS
jgi:lysophospholipase L1-like esterase